MGWRKNRRSGSSGTGGSTPSHREKLEPNGAQGTTVEISGPLFSPRARQIGHDWAEGVTARVAAYALERVMFNLDGSLKDPTPYYETQINIRDVTLTDRRVNDSGVIYGPWLEGTSTRNTRTRFKGYASFRRAASDTRANMDKLVEDETRRIVQRLGGGR